MLYNVTPSGILCDNYLCSEPYSYNSYDKLNPVPTFKLNESAFCIPKDKLSNYNTNDKIVYIKFEVYCNNDMYCMLILYSNYQGSKLWINDNYYGFSNEWVKRKIIYLKQGSNIIYCELISPNIENIKLYLKELIFNKEYIQDDFNDVKDRYLICDNLDDEVRFIVQSDNDLNQSVFEEVKITVPIINFKKRTIKYKKVDSIIVPINKIQNINLGKYYNSCEFKWVFLELGKQKTRVFIDNIENEYNNLIQKIHDNKNLFSEIEFDQLIKIENQNKNRNDISYQIKYYLLLDRLNKIFLTIQKNNEIDLYKSSGFKEIEYVSKLDNKKSLFGLYVPKNIKETKDLDIIIILSSNGHKTYIESFSSYFSKNYIIIELNLRGNNYGNFLGEFIFFEILDHILSIYKNYNIKNKYLFGYSSCASAVISLAGKYPSLFSGCLAIAGKANKVLLRNVNQYVNTILLYGNYDVDIHDTFFENEKILKHHKGKVKNILLSGFDHTTIACFMRNKYLISKILKFKKHAVNIPKYYGISENYSPNECIKILERLDKETHYFIEIKDKDDKIYIKTSNIKYLEINNIKNKLYVINGNKVKITNKCILNVSLKKCVIENNYDYTKITNGLGILNIYSSSIMFWLNSEKDLDIIQGIYKPKKMTKSPYNQIQYPYKIVKDYIPSDELINSNNVFYNIQLNYNNQKKIICFEDGFEYLGKKFNCKYSIVHIYKNSEKHYNLYINDNDNEYSKKNFFIRNVFIPSEIYDNKSIYTSCAIILMDNTYYYINEYGEEMKKYI